MKTPKCPIVFSAENFKSGDEYLENNMYLQAFVDKANALAAAQWQAYVEGLTEVFSVRNGWDHIWKLGCCVDKQGGDVVDEVTRILPPEEIGK